MNNFYYYNPTKIIFGQGMINNISREIPRDAKVLLLYGQGSIKRNGVYDQVYHTLAEYDVEEFSGITANPEYLTCLEALTFMKTTGRDFILAVGGGSIIDAAKYIALAFYYTGDEPWDFLKEHSKTPNQALPFGTILTIPATGSEMNNSFVISSKEKGAKIASYSFSSYPKFSVLDPSTTFTLSNTQLRNGIVDIFVHVVEQYVTFDNDAPLQDRQAEAILLTIIEIAPELFKSKDNYSARASMMWCAAQALNSQLSRGVVTDGATHDIAHHLTAIYNLDHGQTLALILPGLWHNQIENKRTKLSLFGRRVWAIQGSDNEVAERAISKTEQFFKSLGIVTTFSKLNINALEAAETIKNRYLSSLDCQIGENNNITPEMVYSIIKSRK